MLAGGRALIPKRGLGGPSRCSFPLAKGGAGFSLASRVSTAGGTASSSVKD